MRFAREWPIPLALLGMVAWPGGHAFAQTEGVTSPAATPAPASSGAPADAPSATPAPLPQLDLDTAPAPAPTKPPAVAVPPSVLAPPPPAAPPSQTRIIISKAGLLGGAVVTFVGFYLLVDASAKQGKLDSVCVSGAASSGNSACPQSAAGAINDFNTEMLSGGVATLVGIGMIAVGWLTAPDMPPDAPPPSGAASLRVGPGGLWGSF